MVCVIDAKDSLDLVKSVYEINFVLSIGLRKVEYAVNMPDYDFIVLVASLAMFSLFGSSGIYRITSPVPQFKILQNISIVTVLIGLLCLSR